MKGKNAHIDPKYPTSDNLSSGHDVAVGILGAAASTLVPFSGPVVQGIIKKYVATPTAVRQAHWFNRLGEAVYELQTRLSGFDPKSLDNNEEFLTAVLAATHIALRTHHEEKLEALKNTVLNTAAGLSLDDVVRGSFMQILEQFSASHLEVLRHMSGSEGSMFSTGTSPEDHITEYHGNVDYTGTTLRLHLRSKLVPEVMDRIMFDLNSHGMVSFDPKKGSSDGKLTTYIGDSFLRFVSPPIVS
ncbi:hypothetical protein GOFOIKOB_6320 [Methylobacterium tardum]|uniref:Uncharacterized protein n=1 Tax=Methylobacterium tardum TaxID=374432 RepID=A0AA37WQ44_9HYPH|nr:hypothetical protein [Methylobacterium tardum]URD35798.1 hypothetical protein M6G65_25630 [Methylobacterium tardum]GJE53243.1 hypothetical protein GOFOIKOB_6320 [Methylobacterium tardum]GLS68741.1 hypothetical protein GCM10007890_07530 [Methylobacterium tardum]